MKDERSEIEELNRKQRDLEAALAKEQLKNLALNALIECVEEHYRIDVKKNFGNKVSKKSSHKSKS